MSFANKDMTSTTSSVKSFKCDCCDYTSNRKLNLMRHKNKHLKKVGDEISDISENDEQILTSKECNNCINFKQIIDMKDGRISELERQIELLQKKKLTCLLRFVRTFAERLTNCCPSN